MTTTAIEKFTKPTISQQTHAKTVAEISKLHCGQDRDEGRDRRAPLWPRQRLRSSSILSKPSLAPLPLDLLQIADLISFSPSLFKLFFFLFLVELSLKSDHGLKRSDNKIKKFF